MPSSCLTAGPLDERRRRGARADNLHARFPAANKRMDTLLGYLPTRRYPEPGILSRCNRRRTEMAVESLWTAVERIEMTFPRRSDQPGVWPYPDDRAPAARTTSTARCPLAPDQTAVSAHGLVAIAGTSVVPLSNVPVASSPSRTHPWYQLALPAYRPHRGAGLGGSTVRDVPVVESTRSLSSLPASGP